MRLEGVTAFGKLYGDRVQGGGEDRDVVRGMDELRGGGRDAGEPGDDGGGGCEDDDARWGAEDARREGEIRSSGTLPAPSSALEGMRWTSSFPGTRDTCCTRSPMPGQGEATARQVPPTIPPWVSMKHFFLRIGSR